MLCIYTYIIYEQYSNDSYPRQWPLLSRVGLQTNGQGAKEREYGVEEDGEEETDEEEMGPAHPRGYLLWLLGWAVADPAALTFNPGSALLSWERASGAPDTVRSYEKEVMAMMDQGFACHYFHLSLNLVWLFSNLV